MFLRDFSVLGDFHVAAPKAEGQDAQDDGNNKKDKIKKTKKAGNKSDVKMPAVAAAAAAEAEEEAAAVPDQDKEGGKAKELKNTELDEVAGDDDVEGGGGCFEQSLMNAPRVYYEVLHSIS